MKATVLIVLWVSVAATGCGLAQRPHGPEHCDGYALCDYQDDYEIWMLAVDAELKNEVAGRRPPGGHSSWNERWMASVKALEQGQQGYERYVAYLVERRQALNLPPLEYRN
jgi:hypothetical protein